MQRLKDNKMVNPLKHYYDESYFKQRNYEFAVKSPFFRVIAWELTDRFNPKSLLDIGCAKGYMVYVLRDMGVESYGVDISEYAITNSPESVRNYLSRVDVDLEDLPFEDGMFDMVTVLECIEHLQNYNHLISEIRRVLKTSGTVMIMFPNSYREKSIGRLFYGTNKTHVNVRTKSFWINTFRNHGFKCLGSFPKEVQREARHAAKGETIETILGHPVGIEKFLARFGTIGKWLRDRIISFRSLLLSETLLFRKV